VGFKYDKNKYGKARAQVFNSRSSEDLKTGVCDKSTQAKLIACNASTSLSYAA